MPKGGAKAGKAKPRKEEEDAEEAYKRLVGEGGEGFFF
jgi:hypothetical protein